MRHVGIAIGYEGPLKTDERPLITYRRELKELRTPKLVSKGVADIVEGHLENLTARADEDWDYMEELRLVLLSELVGIAKDYCRTGKRRATPSNYLFSKLQYHVKINKGNLAYASKSQLKKDDVMERFVALAEAINT